MCRFLQKQKLTVKKKPYAAAKPIKKYKKAADRILGKNQECRPIKYRIFG